MSVLTGILGALPVVGKLLRKKPYCLWYQGLDKKWRKRGGPFSARQCRKTIKALVVTGFDPDRFGIFREGVDPNKGPGE